MSQEPRDQLTASTTEHELIWVCVFSGAGQLLLVGILVSGVALYASHRIAGPLIRLEHGLRGLAQGDLTAKLQFRRGDQDRSLPGAFDALREDVSQRVATARDTARDLRQLVDDAKTRSWTTAEAEPLLRRIQEDAKRLRQAAALAGDADAS
ncbi:MAG: methyl-accepting chemotaxis protein [Candidatus Hydrogenedentes bacterium]|nr:methyl-accepting chemotaxis protein [Candidatus Hydrogenedentota bacterium]